MVKKLVYKIKTDLRLRTFMLVLLGPAILLAVGTYFAFNNLYVPNDGEFFWVQHVKSYPNSNDWQKNESLISDTQKLTTYTFITSDSPSAVVGFYYDKAIVEPGSRKCYGNSLRNTRGVLHGFWRLRVLDYNGQSTLQNTTDETSNTIATRGNNSDVAATLILDWIRCYNSGERNLVLTAEKVNNDMTSVKLEYFSP